MLLTFLYVFFRGFRENLAKSAYKDILVNYTLLFVFVVTIDIIAKKIRNKRR